MKKKINLKIYTFKQSNSVNQLNKAMIDLK